MNINKPLEHIKDCMLQHCETLAVAESVTSGHLQAAFSLADQATDFFQGGITAYNLGQKAMHLKIDPIHALTCNCVSQKIAIEMATSACNLFCCDWGIGITGYAAPVPKLKINALFAYYAFSRKGENVHAKQIESKKMNIKKVQEHYVSVLLKDFDHYLWNKTP